MAKIVEFYANLFLSTSENPNPLRNYSDANNLNELFVFRAFGNSAGNVVMLEELQGKDLTYCFNKITTLLNPNRQLVVRIVNPHTANTYFYGGFTSSTPRTITRVLNRVGNQLIVLGGDIGIVNRYFKIYVYDINSILPNAQNVRLVNLTFPGTAATVVTNFQNTGFTHRIQNYLDFDISNFGGIASVPTANTGNYLFYELKVLA